LSRPKGKFGGKKEQAEDEDGHGFLGHVLAFALLVFPQLVSKFLKKDKGEVHIGR